jgi:hypothetical protein
MEAKVDEVAPKAVGTIENHAYFKPLFAKLHRELRKLHGAYGHWQGLELFEPLKQIADDLLKIGGIDIQPRLDGKAHVAIPYTPETMPNLAEQMAFLMARNAARKQ